MPVNKYLPYDNSTLHYEEISREMKLSTKKNGKLETGKEDKSIFLYYRVNYPMSPFPSFFLMHFYSNFSANREKHWELM
jgi:hypothetical protein